MISKRTLMKWRKEALRHKKLQENSASITTHPSNWPVIELKNYINKVLELTQELIDQHLMEGK